MVQGTREAVKTPRIAVADDYSDFRDMLRQSFKGAPFECDFCDSGEELLRLSEDNDYDLIISDLAMSPLGGWEVLERLRESHPALPLWAISAYRQRDMMNDVRAKNLNVLLLDKAEDAVGLRQRIINFFGL
jgi:CheY-like chemotaxis protein